jgi:hypothetical protein
VSIQIKLFYSLRHVSALAGTILREFPLYLAKNYLQVVLRLVVGAVSVWQHMSCNNVQSVLYRVIQEESALLWEMIVWVILSKKVHTNMGLILNGYGVMGIFHSCTRPHVNRAYGLLFALQALFLPADSSSQLQTVQVPAQRCSQPSGSLCCGRRWHFRKPALSTDQFKLKVISRC